MTNWPSRVVLQGFHSDDADRFKLALKFRNFTLGDDSITVWLRKEEVEKLKDDCCASLLDDDLMLES